jgi:hypothetical protein
MLFLLSAVAQAGPVNVTACIDIDVDFDSETDGNIWDDNSVDRPALGYRLTIHDNGTFPPYTHDVYLGTVSTLPGQARGCSVPLTLLTTRTYTVKVWPEGSVDGNDFEHLGATPITITSSYVPTTTKTESYVIDASLNNEYQQLLIMAHGLEWHAGGLSGKSFKMDDDLTGPCCVYSAGVVHLTSAMKRRFTIAHEVGHHVAAHVNSKGSADGGADTDGCDGTGADNGGQVK